MLVSREHIVQLWEMFFRDPYKHQTPIQADVKHIRISLIRTDDGTLRDTGEYRPEINNLSEVTTYLAGGILQFNRMFRDTIYDVSFTIEGDNDLVLIPFQVESVRPDDPPVDMFVVLYGQDLNLVSLHFNRLSREGWEVTKEAVRRAYNVTLTDPVIAPVPDPANTRRR